MPKNEFSLVLSLAAHLVAVETGALIVCIGIMILDSGLLASFEGIAVWMFAQLFILPVALFSMPLGILLRFGLGLAFDQPRIVALSSGTLIGLIGSVLFAPSTVDGWSSWTSILLLGLVAGFAGGWAWWRVEKRFLGDQS